MHGFINKKSGIITAFFIDVYLEKLFLFGQPALSINGSHAS
jgi:hypothetical protein